MPEGELTRTRAALVCEESLYEVAKALDLGAHLKLGKGEAAGGGRTRPSILADATEATLAAVYMHLDEGQQAVRTLSKAIKAEPLRADLRLEKAKEISEGSCRNAKMAETDGGIRDWYPVSIYGYG